MKFIAFSLALVSLATTAALPQLTINQCVELAFTTFQCNVNNVSCPSQLQQLKTCGQNCLTQAANTQNSCLQSCLTPVKDISVIQLAQDIIQCVNPTPFVPPTDTYNPNASNNTYTTHFNYCRTITESPCYPVDYVCINDNLGIEMCIGNCQATTTTSTDLLNCFQQKCTSTIKSVQNKINSIITCASSTSSSSSNPTYTQQPLSLTQCVTLAASTFQCDQSDSQCSAQLQTLIACGQNCLTQPSNAQNNCLASCLNGINNSAVLGLAANLQKCVNPTPQVPPQITYDPTNSSNTYTTHFDYCKNTNLNKCNPVDYTCQNQFKNIQACFSNCYSKTTKASDLLSCAQQECSSTIQTISSYISAVVKCASSTTSQQILTIISVVVQLLIITLF
ncbi:hypothetical protein ABPG74_019602 [Tetrahymena malaccensis]